MSSTHLNNDGYLDIVTNNINEKPSILMNYPVYNKPNYYVKIKLKEVDDSIPMGGFITDFNTFRPVGVPHHIGDIPQFNIPHISTIPNGTGGNPTPPTITTTPGYGSISIASGFGLGSTSTTYGYPSGSAWSYTRAVNAPPYTTGDGMDDNI
jgi:hypothetical protein